MDHRLGSDSEARVTTTYSTAQTSNILSELTVRSGPLVGKKAVVTGGSRGIGKAIVIELARLGANVVIGYRHNRFAAENTMRQANFAYGMGLTSIKAFDLLNPQGIEPMECDVLVHCAGTTAGRGIRRTEWHEWDEVLDVNLTGMFAMAKACVDHMASKEWGRIIAVTSVVGLDGRLGPTSYAASKAGLVGWVKAAAHELARKGILVNAVAPGFIADTGLIDAVPPYLMPEILKTIPLKRLGNVEDVAQAVGYLVKAKYVTGTVLNVSGGYLT